MSEYKLTAGILSLSVSQYWPEAVLEWKVDKIIQLYPGDEPETCLCGHYPIMELCWLVNIENGNRTLVGNCCVTKFRMEDWNTGVFRSIHRAKECIDLPLHSALIKHAWEKHWIDRWSYDFYRDTIRKRKLSDRQMQHRIRINSCILKQVTAGKKGAAR
jgi:hypothetical protein